MAPPLVSWRREIGAGSLRKGAGSQDPPCSRSSQGPLLRQIPIPTHHEGREGPSAAKPQPNFGLSPAKTQRPQRERNIYPNLVFLAPWREEYPNPRCFVSWKIRPSRANFQG